VLDQLLEDKVVTTSRAQSSQASPPTRQLHVGLHPKPMDDMIDRMMSACSDGIVLFQASVARGSERVLLDRQCRSDVVLRSYAAVLHTVRRFGLAFRVHYGCEQYLSKKLHECPCGYHGCFWQVEAVPLGRGKWALPGGCVDILAVENEPTDDHLSLLSPPHALAKAVRLGKKLMHGAQYMRRLNSDGST